MQSKCPITKFGQQKPFPVTLFKQNHSFEHILQYLRRSVCPRNFKCLKHVWNVLKIALIWHCIYHVVQLKSLIKFYIYSDKQQLLLSWATLT